MLRRTLILGAVLAALLALPGVASAAVVVNGQLQNTPTVTGTEGNDTFQCLGGAHTINALGGNDTIVGTGIASTIDAGAGDDIINTIGAAATVDGGDGADKFVGS